MQKKPTKRPILIGRAIARKGEEFDFDYKDVATLARFISESGIIIPRERTGLANKQQRALAREIKRARFLGMLPFVTTL